MLMKIKPPSTPALTGTAEPEKKNGHSKVEVRVPARSLLPRRMGGNQQKGDAIKRQVRRGNLIKVKDGVDFGEIHCSQGEFLPVWGRRGPPVPGLRWLNLAWHSCGTGLQGWLPGA
jgi:hypothetical protein